MRIAKAIAALTLTAGVAACQHTGMYPNNDLNEIASLIGSGLGRVEIYTPPTTTYYRRDDAYCEAYRFRQYAYGGPRYGEGDGLSFPEPTVVPGEPGFRSGFGYAGSAVASSSDPASSLSSESSLSSDPASPSGRRWNRASTGQWVPFNF